MIAEAPAATAPSRGTIFSVQVMRAVAAIAVTVYHTRIILGQPEYGGLDVFAGIASKGWVGVNFFFVLSGFIIIYAHVGDIGQPARIGRYIWRRFSRIYPFYWLCLTAFMSAALLGMGHPEIRWTLGDLASSYLLVPFVSDPVLPIHVAWTLFYELQFYLVFLVLILSRTGGLLLFLAWGAAILSGGVWLGGNVALFHPWNIYFFFGIGVFYLLKQLDPRLGLPILLGGLITFGLLVALGLVDDRIAGAQASGPKLVLLAIPFAMILLGGILWERGSGWRPARFLVLLGEASYSIYLIHSPTLSLIAGVNHALLKGVLPAEILFVAAALMAVAAGVVVHLLVEQPLLRAFRGTGPLFGTRRPPRLAEADA